MSETIPALADFQKRIHDAKTLTELEDIEQELFGRKSGVMTLAMKKLQDLPTEKKPEAAKELNQLKKKYTEEIEKKKAGLKSPSDKDLKDSDALSATLSLPSQERGHLHLIPEFIRQVEEVFGRMGFDVSRGPEIETEENNFTLLNIPEDHPARDAQDTFWVKTKSSKERKVLRTHTSPVQIHYMQTHKPPFRMICPGKVYRKDADATHSPMFHQFEGLMIGEDVSLANMKAVMVTAIRELISKDAEFRFRTGFFPFVEPGLEVDMMWQGDNETREGKWLEIVGCGMVHPNVLENVGIDPKKWQGFAFGFGIERMIMIKHQIPDLRSFYQGDMRFLRQF
jgi:phenylalanyl-tRNA synthetase alpha chain